MEKRIIVKKDQNLVLPLFWQGAEDVLKYDIILKEEGASVNMIGLLLGKLDHELSLTVNVTHAAPNTTSKVAVSGALTDFSKVSFDGLVTINKGAKKSVARLDAHVLLLSDQAKGRLVPSLEIAENDIKAGHAATVGKVDPLQLFYMQSRGLDAGTAKRLVVEGFLMKTINQFPKELADHAIIQVENYVTKSN